MSEIRAATDGKAQVNRFQAFSEWLDEFSPRHKSLRTPAYLEADAPAAMREFWEAVGVSDCTGIGAGRPEQLFMRPLAEKAILEWFGRSDVREAWGVQTPHEALVAVRAKLPSRFRWISNNDLTDETDGRPDPPVWAFEGGRAEPRSPSVADALVWHTSRKSSGIRRQTAHLEFPPDGREIVPGILWEIGRGVFALAPMPHLPDSRWHRAFDDSAQRGSILYQTPRHYFDWVMTLPDEAFAVQHYAGYYGLGRCNLVEGKVLDPETISLPGVRRSAQNFPGSKAPWIKAAGLVNGIPLWLRKYPGNVAVSVWFEPDDLPRLRALFEAEKIRPYDIKKPFKDPSAKPATQAEKAKFAKLADKARAAAEKAARLRGERA